MRKVATVTMVKNEQDIIEEFVRYTMNYADCMYIIDNGCTDATMLIVEKLQDEYEIVVIDEILTGYEQYLIENKYIHEIANTRKFDLIIPLDADEFLVTDGELKKKLNSISLDQITKINWKTFVINHDITSSVFDEVHLSRINEKRVFTKVIIPSRFATDNSNFKVTMGHHSIENEENYAVYTDMELWMGHVPVRSKTQIQLKVLQGLIAQMTSENGFVSAFHWMKVLHKLENNKFDIQEVSYNYGLKESECIDPTTDVREEKIDIAWCVNIEKRYTDNLQNDLAIVITKETLIAEARKKFDLVYDAVKRNVLVYVIGKETKRICKEIEEHEMNVIGYIKNDSEYLLTEYEHRLVVTPKYLKYFNYDGIVIAGNNCEDIIDKLIKDGISETKIIVW